MPSADYEGYIYESLIEIGAGGVTCGVFLGVMKDPNEPEEEKRLVTLKFIAKEYLNHAEFGPRRTTSLEREAECLNKVLDLEDNAL